ncbi:caspase family protein [uncultured Duncaniella sp.]|uniref:caspase family protein n=1 Tax=uncultured Duncaniella sp. TaxID=2768039 RepID=UPI0026768254|nr:caspase family protein [uncultured Duncaniella sp.]MCI9172529.1 caspase family protein [Muribaculaceae bacterium]
MLNRISSLLIIIILILCQQNIFAETYAVCVGVNYNGSKHLSKLNKAENDAKSMSEFFKKGGARVVTITGHYATKSEILKRIKSHYGKASQSDRIILFFSGHGFKGGLCPYDMRNIESGISYNEIIKLMQKSKAKTKMIFADACNSGTFRSDKTYSSTNRNTNVLLFLSSRGSESSIESRFLANGYFTKYLLRGLRGGADANRDRRVTAYELYDFVSKNVATSTKNRQHPVMWGRFDDDMVMVDYAL